MVVFLVLGVGTGRLAAVCGGPRNGADCPVHFTNAHERRKTRKSTRETW